MASDNSCSIRRPIWCRNLLCRTVLFLNYFVVFRCVVDLLCLKELFECSNAIKGIVKLKKSNVFFV